MKSQVWIGKKRLKKPLIQEEWELSQPVRTGGGQWQWKRRGAETISAAQIGFLQP